jgi:predicted DNA-binding protein
MSRKKVSTTIYITPEQADRLKLLHERTKVPISVYIREGIDLMLKHYEHVLPGQMSLESAASSGSAPPPASSAGGGGVLHVTPVGAGTSVTPVTSGSPRREPVATLRTGSTGHADPHPPGSRAQTPGAATQAGPTRSGDSSA